MSQSSAALTFDRLQSARNNLPRLDTIDLLRGIVLILMALDHSRHYFSNIENPLDLTLTTPLLFFTRWITHYCAPIFIFLAGMSAYLYQARTQCNKQTLSQYLFTRGVWLIFLECTLIYASWTFYILPFHLSLQIFWAIGASMLILSGLIYLPRKILFFLSLIVIVGHNLLDPITPATLQQFAWLWHILHVPGDFTIYHLSVMVWYPITPWFAVMALGYVMGPMMLWPEQIRNPFFIRLGIALCLLFLTVRFLNVYGDPISWQPQNNFLYTVLAFINCEKYPPSLDYLLMTLGPAFIALGLIKQAHCHYSISKILIHFGRVPFFFYILHVPLIFSLVFLLIGSKQGLILYALHPAYRFNLPLVYLVWVSVCLALYKPCVWYGKYKAANRSWMLSYL